MEDQQETSKSKEVAAAQEEFYKKYFRVLIKELHPDPHEGQTNEDYYSLMAFSEMIRERKGRRGKKLTEEEVLEAYGRFLEFVKNKYSHLFPDLGTPTEESGPADTDGAGEEAQQDIGGQTQEQESATEFDEKAVQKIVYDIQHIIRGIEEILRREQIIMKNGAIDRLEDVYSNAQKQLLKPQIDEIVDLTSKLLPKVITIQILRQFIGRIQTAADKLFEIIDYKTIAFDTKEESPVFEDNQKKEIGIRLSYILMSLDDLRKYTRN